MKKSSYKEICFSIIGSLICMFFIEPFLRFLGKVIFFISDKLFSSVSNSLYISVGQERYDLDFITACFIFLLLFSLLLILYLKIFLDTKHLLSKTNELMNSIENKASEHPVHEIEDIENKTKKLSDKLKSLYRKSITLGSIFGILFIFCSTILLSIQITIKDKVYLYRNAKIIVTPYIDKIDLEVIDSKFHQIQSKEEYDNIFFEFNELLQKNGKTIIITKNNQIELN